MLVQNMYKRHVTAGEILIDQGSTGLDNHPALRNRYIARQASDDSTEMNTHLDPFCRSIIQENRMASVPPP
ncbi:hypothetical protein QJQ45_016354 [Haematococcus lacustris]|nr:hypothetical protein QJQ45_016354 [Haematococcus lacustris]